MDLTRHWLESQKATPSFVSTFENISDILDAPLPAALRFNASPRNMSMNRSQTPPATMRSQSRSGAAGMGMGAMTPGRRVHDELIEKGKLYEQRREALREKYIAEEQKSYTPRKKKEAAAAAARMSREEQRRMQEEEERARKKRFEKLWVDGKKRNEEGYYRRLRADKAEKEKLDHYGFKPKISNKGKRTTSRLTLVEQQTNWQRRKEEELERLRRERIVNEMAEVQEGPDISLRSQKIALRQREREGLAGLSHIEAMLERDRLRKLGRWEENQKEKIKESTNPKITVYAATLPRGGDVGDRLYAESFDMEERKAQRIREKLGAKQESFTPRITPFANSVVRERPVEDELMMRHLDALAERDEACRHQDERRLEQHTPAINPVSDAIASRLAVSAKERLLQPRSSKGETPNASIERSQFGRSTSNASMSSTGSFADREKARFERIEKDEQRKKERLAKLKEEEESRMMAECTFTPKTKTRPGGTPARTIGGGSDMYARNEQWQRRREMKMSEQAAVREVSSLQGCTFQPQVHHYDPTANSEETIYGGDGKPWGVDEFIQRQNDARKEREDRTAKQTTDTSNWKPGSTVPDEFQFHHSTNVRALDRPVAPQRLVDTPPPLPAMHMEYPSFGQGSAPTGALSPEMARRSLYS